MRERLDIAAALLGDPQVPLFGEPVTARYRGWSLWIRNLLKSLVEILHSFTAHSLGHATAIAPLSG